MGSLNKITKMSFLAFIATFVGLCAYDVSFYLQCEEPEPDMYTSLMVWLNIAEVEKQCPALESVVMEIILDISKLAMVMCCAILPMFILDIKRISSLFPSTIGTIHLVERFCSCLFKAILTGATLYDLWWSVVHIAQRRRLRSNNTTVRTNVKYHFYKNAYTQRKEVIILRTSDQDETTFRRNPKTKKFECILWFPKDTDTS